MRLEPLYRVQFSYTAGWGADLAGPENPEGRFFFLAEGRSEGRISGQFRGANHPHRRSDGTFQPDFQGVIETDDGAEVLFDYRGYGLPDRSEADSDERNPPERGRTLPLAQRLAECGRWRGPLTRGRADGVGHRVGRGGVGAGLRPMRKCCGEVEAGADRVRKRNWVRRARSPVCRGANSRASRP